VRRRIRLTGRGFTLLVLGLLTSVAAAIVGERSLLWITGALVLLPLTALAHLLLAPPRVSAARAAAPQTLPLGETARVVVELTNEAPAQPAALRFTDQAPSPAASDVGHRPWPTASPPPSAAGSTWGR
jgi:uncharacterized protein (DUF58 family)